MTLNEARHLISVFIDKNSGKKDFQKGYTRGLKDALEILEFVDDTANSDRNSSQKSVNTPS